MAKKAKEESEEETCEGKRYGGRGWVGGSTGRTSPVVFTTYHRKSMIARTARFNEIPLPFLYM